MNCLEVEPQLSAFHDRQLMESESRHVVAHLASCRRCCDTFSAMQRMSHAFQDAADPSPPAYLWVTISGALDRERHRTERRRFWGTLAATASSLAAGGLVISLIRRGSLGGAYRPNAVRDANTADFATFLGEFAADPLGAQRRLVDRFRGRRSTAEQAARIVGYRPLAGGLDLEGYRVDGIYVLQMPCCVCSETLIRRTDGSILAVFEHANDEPDWFAGRPMIVTECNRKAVKLVELSAQLAATWTQRRRAITAVGIRDIAEIIQLIHRWDDVAVVASEHRSRKNGPV